MLERRVYMCVLAKPPTESHDLKILPCSSIMSDIEHISNLWVLVDVGRVWWDGSAPP